jgi:N-acylneuraminate cytidylyltransferase/CMP-N,N'-diacetyllegionaminic acid synthase
MRMLAIIPARAGSKGVKNKNIYPIAGKPLIEWTKEAAYNSCIPDVVISTDIKELLDAYTQYDSCYYTQKRPDYLCNDDTTMIDVLKDFLNCRWHSWAKSVIVLQPTSPLRTTEDINNAIKLFKESGANSLYSGYYMGIKHKDKVYDKNATSKHFQRNGAIFIAKRELIEQGKLWDDTVIEFEMPLSRSIDIDCMDDMYIAEALLQKRMKEC